MFKLHAVSLKDRGSVAVNPIMDALAPLFLELAPEALISNVASHQVVAEVEAAAETYLGWMRLKVATQGKYSQRAKPKAFPFEVVRLQWLQHSSNLVSTSMQMLRWQDLRAVLMTPASSVSIFVSPSVLDNDRLESCQALITTRLESSSKEPQFTAVATPVSPWTPPPALVTSSTSLSAFRAGRRCQLVMLLKRYRYLHTQIVTRRKPQQRPIYAQQAGTK